MSAEAGAGCCLSSGGGWWVVGGGKKQLFEGLQQIPPKWQFVQFPVNLAIRIQNQHS